MSCRTPYPTISWHRCLGNVLSIDFNVIFFVPAFFAFIYCTYFLLNSLCRQMRYKYLYPPPDVEYCQSPLSLPIPSLFPYSGLTDFKLISLIPIVEGETQGKSFTLLISIDKAFIFLITQGTLLAYTHTYTHTATHTLFYRHLNNNQFH